MPETFCRTIEFNPPITFNPTITFRRTIKSLIFSGLLPASAVFAQTGAVALKDVIITGNPLGSGLFDLATPASQLSGSALTYRRSSSLGETLSNEIGVSSSYFGPNASRPIIRGLDGDRIRIMQNGEQAMDASSLSFDHSSTIDPLIAERIEIVRGPAALLYGGSAVGGVVNVIDNRIPTAPINAPQGRVELRAGSADRENSGSAVVEAGNGDFAVHADMFQRRNDDVKIPGFARSSRLRANDDPAAEQPRGVLRNTFGRSEGGALGGSMTWANGYAGLSFASMRSSYGTPAEADVKIDMQKDTVGVAMEARKVSPLIDSIRFRLGQSDYQHQEKVKETGAVNTTFKSRGYEGRFDIQHAAIGRWRGSVGAQVTGLDFSALGEEAFVPVTRSGSQALFLFEEASFDAGKLNFGLRTERTKIRSQGGDDVNAPARLGAAATRNFTANSASLGAVINLTPALLVAGNLSKTERAPTNYELFSNGPHGATGTYETGDPNFSKERSTSFDIALRYRAGPINWSFGVFQTRFSNYLLLTPSGRNRAANGDLEDTTTPGLTAGGEPADLPEYQYLQVPARFRGLEASGKWRALERGGTLDLEARIDSVSAVQTDTDQPLPRITPMRIGIGAIYQTGAWTARADLMHAFGQTRVAVNETTSDGYSLVNALLSYRFKLGSSNAQVYLRANNLLNVEARSHTSLLKEVAPLPGRNFMLGLQASF